MNINVFLLFFSFVFLLVEREREMVYKIGYKEKQSQSYLSYLDGFLWRIFLLLRADRLYLIFSTGLKIRLLLVRDFFFSSSFTRSIWLWVPSATNPVQQLTSSFFFFRRREEGATSVFRVPANHLASTFFLPVSGDPSEVPKHKHLFLTVILWRLATVNSNTRIVEILFLSSQWKTTWHFIYKWCYIETRKCFYIASLWLRQFLWIGRWREVFAPSYLCVWSQRPWQSRQIILLLRGFLHVHLQEFDG